MQGGDRADRKAKRRGRLGDGPGESGHPPRPGSGGAPTAWGTARDLRVNSWQYIRTGRGYARGRERGRVAAAQNWRKKRRPPPGGEEAEVVVYQPRGVGLMHPGLAG